MNYVKKMCILRQVKQGFSGDGKALSGLIKIEQYGKNLSVEVSIINFAPLALGEYYCLLSDGKGKTEMLALRGKSLFNILSDLDISRGFCGIICYVNSDVIPIAYGINGNGSYDWRTILNATLPPIFPQKSNASSRESRTEIAKAADESTPTPLPQEERKTDVISVYDDEEMATENYYREDTQNGQELLQKVGGDARAQSTDQSQGEKTRLDASENVDADDVRHPFETDGDGYYRAVKTEIDELLQKYPADDTLKGAFSCSEWVRVQGEKGAPKYLVGVVWEEGKAKYICYALAAEDKNIPPEEISAVCTFVPVSPFEGSEGFFVIFQSAATGECIKPQKA